MCLFLVVIPGSTIHLLQHGQLWTQFAYFVLSFIWKLCTLTRVIVFFRQQRGTVGSTSHEHSHTNHTSALANETSSLHYRYGY
jgi:hypothetical protein